MKSVNVGFVALSLVLSSASVTLADGDATKGEAVFKKCMACHRIGEGAKNLIGPVLNGVIGRQSGTAPGFSYSALNKSAGEASLVWTPERIFTYLENPNAFLKKFLTDAGKPELAVGATKMIFNLQSPDERNDVIAYVMKFSPPPPAK